MVTLNCGKCVEGDAFLPGHLLPDERQLLPDDLIHLLLDQLQV